MTGRNRQIRLASRPDGIPQADNFAMIEDDVPEAADGELLVRNLYLSVEPAMRGWIVDKGNYSAPVAIGEVMRSLAVGCVEQTNVDGFEKGALLLGWFGWQEWAAATPDKVIRRIRETDLSPSLALGVLGLNGVTASLGLDRIGRPRPGETVLVSTAAGAVGSAVGQLARLQGCRTIGIAGGPDKVAACLSDFGYDAAIDYRSEDVDAALAHLAPRGVDVYFDNTAGSISDAALKHLAIGARVVVCGTAAIARWDPPPTGPRVERHILTKRARMEGFVIFDHMDAFDPTAARLAELVRDGRLRFREEMEEGIESCPGAIAKLYLGANKGKLIIRLGQ
ncbi:NADP-dependent oxidoreductase [Sphingosinicella terrae]|uniref:NADP-dependent oxidoreductase n=1 Tax=Sphingosinicella terrae TaxID=2172047 RepID=UPI000E0CD8C5|nr:NADP-dependent oxidoreductase [Sphingosinicella terrae]